MATVALFIPDLGGGGAERVVVALANAFVRRGISVDLVLARLAGPLVDALDARVHIRDLGVRFKPSVVVKLARYLRDNPDVVLLSHMDMANVAALASKKLAFVDSSVVVCSHVVIQGQVDGARRVKDRVLTRAMRWLYPTATAAVAVSNGVRAQLLAVTGLPTRRVTVIHNPIDVDEIARVSRRVKRESEPRAGRTIVAVGRLVVQKDYPTILRAIAIVAGKRPVRLQILGDGPLRPSLERLRDQLGLREIVEFVGYTDRVYEYMARADLLVLGSRWEGFGNVLVEAMACGTPVVSTDCPSGPSEILEHGRYGTLVPVGDIDAFAAAILDTLDNPLPATMLRERGAEFSVDRAVDSYLRVAGVSIGNEFAGA